MWYFYCLWFIFGTLIGVAVPFVCAGILNGSENLARSAGFVIVNLFGLLPFIKRMVLKRNFQTIVVALHCFLPFMIVTFLIVKVRWEYLPAFPGRIRQLFDRQRAPEIGTVLEHQPASWSTFYLYCGPLLYLFPLGFFLLVRQKKLFVVTLGTLSIYFGAMMRLILVFRPTFVLITAVVIDKLLKLSVARKSFDSFMGACILICFLVQYSNHTVYFSFNALSDNYLNFQIETSEGIEWSNDYIEAYC
jgi:dolichyl-diphosphooligosaccharide--protein glycosyltransferase